ncbi:MAG: HIT family protein [Syntrophomonadaceae bacterium]|jgi:diadenosine tetraphosphate (Ap4A) HIT family hydrolase|nr:HIT family protein [Syntrophomonadaceae bacterium]
MESKCIFCNQEEIILDNELAWARYDKYPVSPGHLLIITKRHVADFFDTTIEERRALNSLLEECKKMLDREYSPDGYNIGVNCGTAAGQTIMHLHIHLIPRYQGDIDNPRGGVRGVIPEKRIY